MKLQTWSLKKIGLRQDPTLNELADPSWVQGPGYQDYFWNVQFAPWLVCSTLRHSGQPCAASGEATKWVLHLPTERLIAHAASPGDFPSSRIIITLVALQVRLWQIWQAHFKLRLNKAAALHAWGRRQVLPNYFSALVSGLVCKQQGDLHHRRHHHHGRPSRRSAIAVIDYTPCRPGVWRGITLPSQTLVQQGSFMLQGY